MPLPLNSKPVLYPGSCPRCGDGCVVLDYDPHISDHSLTCINCGWVYQKPEAIHPPGRTLEASYWSGAA